MDMKYILFYSKCIKISMDIHALEKKNYTFGFLYVVYLMMLLADQTK
jgi:hypothetical protein